MDAGRLAVCILLAATIAHPALSMDANPPQTATGGLQQVVVKHGAQMPGLAKLTAAKRGEISIQYGELPEGAQIEYSSKSENLIAALHAWFDAQLADHGADAMSGHEHTLQH